MKIKRILSGILAGAITFTAVSLTGLLGTGVSAAWDTPFLNATSDTLIINGSGLNNTNFDSSYNKLSLSYIHNLFESWNTHALKNGGAIYGYEIGVRFASDVTSGTGKFQVIENSSANDWKTLYSESVIFGSENVNGLYKVRRISGTAIADNLYSGSIVIESTVDSTYDIPVKIEYIQLLKQDGSTFQTLPEVLIVPESEPIILPITTGQKSHDSGNTDVSPGVYVSFEGYNVSNVSFMQNLIIEYESPSNDTWKDLFITKGDQTEPVNTTNLYKYQIASISNGDNKVSVSMKTLVDAGMVDNDLLFIGISRSDWHNMEIKKVYLSGGSSLLTDETQPTAVIDYENETLTELDEGEYTINSDGVSIGSDGTVAIDSAWFGEDISIIKTASNAFRIDSKAQILPIPAYPSAPTGIDSTKIYLDSSGIIETAGTITGVTAAMEYKLSTDSEWLEIASDGTIDGIETAGQYDIRYKAASDSFASLIKNVTVDIDGWADIEIITEPENKILTETEITGSLSVEATISDSSGTLLYQWYSNTTNSTSGGSKIDGEDEASFDIPTGLTKGDYYYYCVVSADINAVSKISRVTLVTVNAKVYPVTGVELNKSTLELEKGKSETLTATITPTNATNQTVSWSSDKTSVATVDQTGKVTAIAEGTAKITVKTADGNIEDYCDVTVTVPAVIRPTVGDRIITNSEAVNDGSYSQLRIEGVNQKSYYSDIYGFEVKVAFTSGIASVELCANSDSASGGWRTLINTELEATDNKVIKYIKDDGSSLYGTSSWAQFFIQNLGKEASGNTDYEVVYIYALGEKGNRLTETPLFGTDSGDESEVNYTEIDETATVAAIEAGNGTVDKPIVIDTSAEEPASIINASLIGALKELGKEEVAFEVNGYVLILDLTSANSNFESLNLYMLIAAADDAKETDTAESLGIDGKNAVVIEPAASGEFGIKVTIFIPAEQIAATGLTGSNSTLWYVGDNGDIKAYWGKYADENANTDSETLFDLDFTAMSDNDDVNTADLKLANNGATLPIQIKNGALVIKNADAPTNNHKSVYISFANSGMTAGKGNKYLLTFTGKVIDTSNGTGVMAIATRGTATGSNGSYHDIAETEINADGTFELITEFDIDSYMEEKELSAISEIRFNSEYLKASNEFLIYTIKIEEIAEENSDSEAEEIVKWENDGVYITIDHASSYVLTDIDLSDVTPAATYKISFNANGGSGTMSAVTGISGGASQKLTKNAFTRTGYTFNGWAISASGSKVYNDEATITNISADIALYATWTEDSSTTPNSTTGGYIIVAPTTDTSTSKDTSGDNKSDDDEFDDDYEDDYDDDFDGDDSAAGANGTGSSGSGASGSDSGSDDSAGKENNPKTGVGFGTAGILALLAGGLTTGFGSIKRRKK